MFKEIFKNKDFLKICISGFISKSGTYLTLVAILALSYKITGSKTSLGLSSFFFIFPTLFSGFFSGIFTDKYNKRNIMIVADVSRAIIVLAYILAVKLNNIYIVYLTSVIISLSTVFFKNAQKSIIPYLTNQNDVVKLNSFYWGNEKLTFIFSTFLVGFLVLKLGFTIVFIIDSLTYVISSTIIYSMASPPKALENQKSHVKLFIEGFNHIKSINFLKQLFIGYSLHGFALGIMNIVPLILIVSTYKKTSSWFGTYWGIMGIAGLISSYIIGRYLTKIVKTKFFSIFIISVLLEILVLVAITNTINFYIFLVLSFFFGILDAIIDVSETSYILYKSDNKYVGRINAVNHVGYQTLYGLGMLFCGLVSDLIKINIIIYIACIAFVLIVFLIINKIGIPYFKFK